MCLVGYTSHPPPELPPSRPSHRIIGLGLRGPSQIFCLSFGPERNQMKGIFLGKSCMKKVGLEGHGGWENLSWVGIGKYGVEV